MNASRHPTLAFHWHHRIGAARSISSARSGSSGSSGSARAPRWARAWRAPRQAQAWLKPLRPETAPPSPCGAPRPDAATSTSCTFTTNLSGAPDASESSLRSDTPGRWPIERHHTCPLRGVHSKSLSLPECSGYLRLGGFRKRTPSPPALLSMNSMPADSNARLTTSKVARRGSLAPASNCLTVTMPTPASSAKSCCFQLSSPRAALHCAGVTMGHTYAHFFESINSVQNALT